MKKRRDEVLIVADDSTSPLRWLIEHLAKHPVWVTSATFVGGAVVAWIVLAIDGRLTLTDAVTLLATLWALFFAVMIYLLSAEDTDHILGQISDLQDQLSTALSEPGAEDAEPATPADSSTETPEAAEPVPTRPAASVVEPAETHIRSRDPRPRVLTSPAEIAESVPEKLIVGWTQGTGLPASAIRRAWSRDPRRQQWVIETDGARWAAFFRRGDNVALVPLHSDFRRRDDRRARLTRGEPRGSRSDAARQPSGDPLPPREVSGQPHGGRSDRRMPSR